CMRTRSQTRNRNRHQQQQLTPVIVEVPEIPMADNHTMAELLQAPTGGFEDAIVIHPFQADNFELKPIVALPAVDRTDSIFFISYSPFPQTPSPPPPQILSPPISPTRIEIPESCLPPRKRPHLASPTPIYEVGETSAAGAARHDVPAIPREDPYVVAREDLYKFVDMVDDAPRHPGCPISRELDYGITDEWDGLVEAIEEIAPTTIEGVNRNITDLSTTFDQETTIMHGLMEDARDDRSELRGRVNLLYRDRPIHHHLAVMVEREAWMAREAWGFSMDVSDDVFSKCIATKYIIA
ncbi:hypothetical protein Tco_0543927, partial [Tanacetum coccineum]